jgi:hypothetical protein
LALSILLIANVAPRAEPAAELLAKMLFEELVTAAEVLVGCGQVQLAIFHIPLFRHGLSIEAAQRTSV